MLASQPIVTLKPGHVQPVWAGHPWVYQQAVLQVEAGARAGDEVAVVDPRGNFLGRGFYTPDSAIAVRLLVRDEETKIDLEFFRRRIERAVARRASFGLPSADTDAYRVVHAEGDDLPGLVVDRFAGVVVVQFGSMGMKQREQMVLDAIEQALAPRAILDRTSASAAKLEGIVPSSGVVRGDASIDKLVFRERGLAYELPLGLTQKTGFYFDQRPLRDRVEQLARGRRVLDAFSYVGTFSLAAARGGASEVTAVDENALALSAAAVSARLNGFEDRVHFVRGDARRALNQSGQEGGVELVICDPPKLAPTRGSRMGALHAYQRLAAAACRATSPGGLLVFCSCSAAVGLEALTRALSLGARDANVRATVLERFFQGPDHPVPAPFPEGLYLKSLLAIIEPAREPGDRRGRA